MLPTIREQKHLLYHRSHCRYRDRPQIAPRVLAQGWIYLTAPVTFLFLGSQDTFLASKNWAAVRGLGAAHLLEAALWATDDLPCER